MKTIKNSTDIGKFSPLLAGISSGVVFGIVMSIVLGIIYYFTPITENILPAISLIILVLSTFWGGKTTASLIGSKGLIWGVVVGVFLFFLILIVSTIIGGDLLLSSVLKKFVFCIIGGALGGVFGVSK